ncbi:uroporphyrinogen-III synthase [Agrococcus carbonis]|uniref:Uroporphyrinogen-III synthase n=2 Tax=Agrococcus carbonis TaxID=684552 RepID=A0A1H1P496_9MICO|nr:uroporphyrinogen-III synthase [Agrococcus carbonis]
MRVLIPRGGSWGDDVARRVAAVGFEPVVVPLVQTAPAEDQERLRAMLEQLTAGRFDWLVVTSQSTVRVLRGVPANVSVAAVGSVTAAALRERGIPVAFIPTRQSAAGLVDEWPIRAGRVLWPHALDAKPTIAEGLRRHGMQVTEVVAYRTTPVFASADDLAEAVRSAGAPEPADALRHQAELQAAARDTADDALATATDAARPAFVDAVLVTSGSVAKQVARLGLGPAALVVAMGEQTAEDCRRAGLAVAAVAERPSPEGLVAALTTAAPAA